MRGKNTFDVVVVGAGVFGAWTAYQLRETGASVLVVDAFGAANSRSSSGGESRIIRMGYGPDEIYTRSAMRSYVLWREFLGRIDTPLPLFHKCGVLWVAREEDPYSIATLKTLQQEGVPTERLDSATLKSRYSQFAFEADAWGILEPESGVIMARRAVQSLVRQTLGDRTKLLNESVIPVETKGKLESIVTSNGTRISADTFVFACGPWLQKLFPALLEGLFQITRQEVFFFGTAAGDNRFSPTETPAWIDFNDLVYAIPNLENRGFKLAIDEHGPEFDPDQDDRVTTASGLRKVQDYLVRRVPALSKAPVTETRVCQYENTTNGDFLIDRHPDSDNIWLVGGGSGHGFKHGPAVGEYLVRMISGVCRAERRFELETKGRQHRRQVY